MYTCSHVLKYRSLPEPSGVRKLHLKRIQRPFIGTESAIENPWVSVKLCSNNNNYYLLFIIFLKTNYIYIYIDIYDMFFFF